MLIEIKVPILAESVSEATLATWRKHPGDFVRQNENLVDMETDKVMLEIVAPKDGVLKEIKKGEGENVTSNEIIAIIDTEAKTSDGTAGSTPAAKTMSKDKSVSANDATILIGATGRTNNQAAAELSPAVRKIVAEHGIDISTIRGTGKDGRITKGDVVGHMEASELKHSQQQSAGEPVQVVEVKPQESLPRQSSVDGRLEKRVPMSRLRARVAERLKEAQNTAAILTTFNEVNMKPVMDLRKKYKSRFEERFSVKLGLMSFFTKAVVESLKQFPVINASVDAGDIIYHGYYDIGIAVGSPRGLVVPILRNADTMSFADIEIAIQAFGRKAKEGKLALEDLKGGTFSISNGGVYGSMLSTPILNPPQSAILGMHNIVERPVVENGEIVVRPMMYLALSYDHRIIDGHDAVMFLVSVKEAIEDPTRMLLEI
jgi:2-oxoglutarate dehydrogenase E2 component (dihydrolipoamide succinyltransferase)